MRISMYMYKDLGIIGLIMSRESILAQWNSLLSVFAWFN